MRLITRNTDYAVRAISYMAGQKDRVVSVPELVRELKVPPAVLKEDTSGLK